MSKETVRVQIDKSEVEEVKKVLKKYNLSLDQAVNMLYDKFILTGQLPYEFKM